VISGVHTIIYADDAEQARAFLRDVLGFRSVDAGDGWLIFAMPPGEIAVHPGDSAGQHEVFLMCHEIEHTVEQMKAKGVEFTGPITDQSWGRVTRFRVPGAGEMGLYEPRHPSLLAEFAGSQSQTRSTGRSRKRLNR
jgi:catechol 2,3-dioxygenase-like lactoylglutathione lyase family enzyme